MYLSGNIHQRALFDAGIHRDNARATLQILKIDSADERAVLMDVARSVVRAERELQRAYRGSVAGDSHGKTATYNFFEIQDDLGNMRRSLMRYLHDLSPNERIPILNILNPPFDLLR